MNKVDRIHNSDLRNMQVYTICFQICGVSRIIADKAWTFLKPSFSLNQIFCHSALYKSAQPTFNSWSTHRSLSNLSCVKGINTWCSPTCSRCPRPPPPPPGTGRGSCGGSWRWQTAGRRPAPSSPVKWDYCKSGWGSRRFKGGRNLGEQ